MRAHDDEAGPRRAPVDLDGETRADALDVLRDLLDWRMAPARWEQVERLVAAMDSALADGDVNALRRATIELELASPVRVTRLGATPQGPPPEKVRERANHMIHSIGSVTTPTPDSGQAQKEDRRSKG
jgi:hypothetical protein